MLWLDIAKALAICCVVYFHFFRTVFEHYQPPPADWSSVIGGVATALRIVWLKLSGLGFHAVGAFIILGGWTVMQSTLSRAANNRVRWSSWYFARFARLYPMYWVAHLVYLFSPFLARFERIDHRIILSLLGLRFVNISMNFYYLNPAWWYFCMLIQLYLIFPLLYRIARCCGPFVFLLGASALGFFVRYLMLVPYPQDGLWILGGFAISRLPEFALGMALAMWHSRFPEKVEWFLLRGGGLLAGLLLYPFALKLYSNGITYVFCDLGTGACFFLEIVGLAGLISLLPRSGKMFALLGIYSYGLYLIHQPYVIWLGLHIRPQPISTFVVIFLITLAILSAWSILLERATNRLVNRILPVKKTSGPSATAANCRGSC